MIGEPYEGRERPMIRLHQTISLEEYIILHYSTTCARSLCVFKKIKKNVRKMDPLSDWRTMGKTRAIHDVTTSNDPS